jgi:thiol-disulfide isomerase/thioredoxin
MIAVVLGVSMLGSTALLVWAQMPATGPATAPAAVDPGADPRAIIMEIQQAATEMQAALGAPDVVTDAAKRDAAAPKVLPALKRMIAGARKLESTGPEMAEQARQMRMQFNVMAATFGDAEARQSLETVSQSGAGEEAATGQAALLLVDWFRSDKDAARQAQILDRAEALAKANPESNAVTEILLAMTQLGAADDATEDRADRIATAMQSDVAQQAKARAAGKAKLEAVEGQPMVITGTTVDGKPFSTADWKGKVVLVDFWATWCGPCIAELPRVKKVYADFHDKGLEILGVSNDMDGEKLKAYVGQNPDMPWPQLFDAGAAARGDWHPVTTGFGIEGIPTMFLIDKKGICRTIEARQDFEEMIPKLLDEQE